MYEDLCTDGRLQFFPLYLLWGSLSLHWISLDKPEVRGFYQHRGCLSGVLPADIHGSPVGQWIHWHNLEGYNVAWYSLCFALWAEFIVVLDQRECATVSYSEQ
ncbi:hypothetical protein DFH05DRAFT_1254655 [Lentinula detonsa]|uniref:Uncharacterized protein n=1 Tax=Lentinula detonsa TaxID=2804962 RepID=A0A9W8NXB0_9AGAR|nr:hypothetical protein DFH05DRAFT_1254655 [Lentinula detonsa]